jgi:hypothetical protein
MPDLPTQSLPREPIEVTYAPSRRPIRKRVGWAFRSWATDTFSRESIVSSLKSLLWVAPLTILIWIYAEREEDVPLTDVPVTLDVRSSDPNKVVRLAPGTSQTIHIDLKGRQVDVEQVKDWLQSNAVAIDVSRNLTPGEHQIYLPSELDRQPRIQNKGITISKCIPAEVTVNVDEIHEYQIEVKARPEDTKTLGSPAIFNPPKVRITGPRSVLDAAGGANIVAYANFEPFKQQLTEPGKHPLSAVALSVPINDPHVRLTPPAVSADIDVTDKAERTITLPYLRVLAAYRQDPGPRADQYKPDYEPTLTNVTVTGPEQQIALLQDPNYTPAAAPAAIFEVNYSDIEHPAPAPLIFHLPPGVHVSEQDAQRKISYTFKPRSTEPQ